MNQQDSLNILIKRIYNKVLTSNQNEIYEEDKYYFNSVLSNRVWSQSQLIPDKNPLLGDQWSNTTEYDGIIKKYHKLVLFPVPGNSNAFYHPDLIDLIPEWYGDGSYKMKLWKKNLETNTYSTQVAPGNGDWFFDYTSGVLVFYGTTLPSEIFEESNYYPAVTVWKYIGTKGDFSSDVGATTGSQGPQGPQGAQGPIDPDPLNFRSEWSISTAYYAGDIIVNNGVAYICLVNNTGQITSNAIYWKQLSPTPGSIVSDTFIDPKYTIWVDPSFTNAYPFFSNLNDAIGATNSVGKWNITVNSGTYDINCEINSCNIFIDCYPGVHLRSSTSQFIDIGAGIYESSYWENTGLRIINGSTVTISGAIIETKSILPSDANKMEKTIYCNNSNVFFDNCSIKYKDAPESYFSIYPSIVCVNTIGDSSSSAQFNKCAFENSSLMCKDINLMIDGAYISGCHMLITPDNNNSILVKNSEFINSGAAYAVLEYRQTPYYTNITNNTIKRFELIDCIFNKYYLTFSSESYDTQLILKDNTFYDSYIIGNHNQYDLKLYGDNIYFSYWAAPPVLTAQGTPLRVISQSAIAYQEFSSMLVDRVNFFAKIYGA